MVRVLQEREVQALEELARQMEERGLSSESARLRLILDRAEPNGDVDASVAARILHASPEAVVSWVRRGMLAGRVGENGQVFVDVDALWRVVELDSAMPYADPAAPDVSEEEILAEIAAYRDEQRAG